MRFAQQRRRTEQNAHPDRCWVQLQQNARVRPNTDGCDTRAGKQLYGDDEEVSPPGLALFTSDELLSDVDDEAVLLDDCVCFVCGLCVRLCRPFFLHFVCVLVVLHERVREIVAEEDGRRGSVVVLVCF